VVGVAQKLNEEFAVGFRFDLRDDVAELFEGIGGDGDDFGIGAQTGGQERVQLN
jgi:hypothetical protein